MYIRTLLQNLVQREEQFIRRRIPPRNDRNQTIEIARNNPANWFSPLSRLTYTPLVKVEEEHPNTVARGGFARRLTLGEPERQVPPRSLWLSRIDRGQRLIK